MKIKVFSPSFNSNKFCINCMQSVALQTFSPVEHFYIDDSSEDDTQRWMGIAAENILPVINDRYRLSLVANSGFNSRKYKLLNLYEYILKCDDEDIICVLDGDDWLASADALQKIADAYSDPAIRYVYTNWQYSHNTSGGISELIPGPDWNPYTDRWITSAMSTFKAKEFRKIPFDNFLRWDYKWFTMGCDQAYVLPILHNIRTEEGNYDSVKFIDEPLYIYQFAENQNKPRDKNDGGMRADAHNSVTFIRNRGYVK